MWQPWVKLVEVEMQLIPVSYHYFLFSTCASHPMNQAGFQLMISLARFKNQSESRHMKTSLSSQDLCFHPFWPSSAIFRCRKVGFRYYYIGYIGPIQENRQRFATYAIQISLHF